MGWQTLVAHDEDNICEIFEVLRAARQVRPVWQKKDIFLSSIFCQVCIFCFKKVRFFCKAFFECRQALSVLFCRATTLRDPYMHLQVRQASQLEILRAHTILTSPRDFEKLTEESARKMVLLMFF